MNKNLILALAAVLAILSYSQFSKESPVNSVIPSHVISMFQEWIIKHDKIYERPQELNHRLKIFFDNYLYVTENNAKNAKEGSSLVLGLNQFADLHVEEFNHSTPSEEGLEERKKKDQVNKQDARKKEVPTLEQQPARPDYVTGRLLLLSRIFTCHLLEVRALLAGVLTLLGLSSTL